VIGVDGAVYKARHLPDTVTIRNGQAFGKYMATIWSVMFMCFIQEEIKSRLKVGNACYYSV